MTDTTHNRPAPPRERPAPRPSQNRRPATSERIRDIDPPRDWIRWPVTAANAILMTAAIMYLITPTGIGLPAETGATVAVIVSIVLAIALTSGIAFGVGLARTDDPVRAWALGGAVLAATTWLVITVMTGGIWTAAALASFGAVLAVAMMVYAAVSARTRRDAEKATAERAAERVERRQHQWDAILAKAGVKGMTVVGETPLPNGGGRIYEIDMADGSAGIPGLTSAIEKITRVASRVVSYPLTERSISVRQHSGGKMHLCELVVLERDVLGENIALPERLYSTRGTVADDYEIGQDVTSEPVKIDRRQGHEFIAGITDGGKSTAMEVRMIQDILRTDTVVWVIAPDKGARLVGPYLLPYLTGAARTARPVLDWIALDEVEAARMLADALRAIDRRQKRLGADGQGWKPTPEDPAISIYIDESVGMLQSMERYPDHRGRQRTPGQLVTDVNRLARSEWITITLASQRGTATMIGADASNIKSQMRIRAAFGSSKGNEGIEAAALFGVDAGRIRLTGLPPGAYAVTDDRLRATPEVIKGYNISPEIRRAAVVNADRLETHGLIDDYTAAGMTMYAGRWTRDSQVQQVQDIITGSGRDVDGDVIAELEQTDPDKVGRSTSPVEPARDKDGNPVYQHGAAESLAAELKRIQDAERTSRVTTAADGAIPDDDELESWFAMAAESDGGAGDSAGGTVDVQPRGPVSPEALAVAAAIRSSGILDTPDEWIPFRTVCEVVCEALGWPGLNDNGKPNKATDSRLSRAIAELDPEIETKPKRAERTISYEVARLAAAVETRREDTT